MRTWGCLLLLLVGFIGLLLAGCGLMSEGDGGSEPSPTQIPSPTATAPPTESPIRLRLQDQYERLTEAQRAILAVWESLAAGGEVRCGEYPVVPAPSSISASGDAAYETLAALLRRAAIEAEHAVQLWQAECTNPRPVPPPDVVREGRLAASAAGDALAEAQRLLRGAGRTPTPPAMSRAAAAFA